MLLARYARCAAMKYYLLIKNIDILKLKLMTSKVEQICMDV